MQPMESFRAHPILSMLPEVELCKLRQRAITKRWKKGDALFYKGDACDGMHGVLSGSIVTFIEHENGNSQSIGTYGPGSYVGMLSLIDGGIRHVTAMVREESSTVFLPRRDFTAAVAGRPDLSARIIGLLCDDIRNNFAHLETMVFLDVPARLARLILLLLQRHAMPDEQSKLPSIRFSQREIADRLGLSREWVGRELVKWREAGIVEVRRSHLVIRDTAALERIRAGDRLNISAAV
jgi:CRP-like cAMP-binding protein